MIQLLSEGLLPWLRTALDLNEVHCWGKKKKKKTQKKQTHNTIS